MNELISSLNDDVNQLFQSTTNTHLKFTMLVVMSFIVNDIRNLGISF